MKACHEEIIFIGLVTSDREIKASRLDKAQIRSIRWSISHGHATRHACREPDQAGGPSSQSSQLSTLIRAKAVYWF